MQKHKVQQWGIREQWATRTGGSLIVLKRSLSITILNSSGTEDGCISYIKSIIACLLLYCKIVFISVQAPNQFEPTFSPNLSDILSEMQDFKVIMGADVNAIRNHVLDRTALLSKFIADFS